MRTKRAEGPDPVEREGSSPTPKIDYSPKTYSLGSQIVFGVKMLVIGVVIFLILWLAEKYIGF